MQIFINLKVINSILRWQIIIIIIGKYNFNQNIEKHSEKFLSYIRIFTKKISHIIFNWIHNNFH